MRDPVARDPEMHREERALFESSKVCLDWKPWRNQEV